QSRTDRPISGYSKAKKRAAILSGVRDWRLHDLRRTAATGMARLGAPDIIVAAVLNHAPRGIMGVTSIYNRHEYLDEKRDALDRWAQHLRDVVTPPSANVVKLATS
ncbi:MAG: tyrosine-type recombinase/integrase, partial [Alphaproteobacteria bacterium]